MLSSNATDVDAKDAKIAALEAKNKAQAAEIAALEAKNKAQAAEIKALKAETAAFKSGTTKETDEAVERVGRALDADVERVTSQVAAGHHSHTESDDEMINVELQLASGPTWITVTRDEKVYDAVADRLQCKLHQLKQINFAGVPLSWTENLTFEDIEIDDQGRLGVDHSVVVCLIPSFV